MPEADSMYCMDSASEGLHCGSLVRDQVMLSGSSMRRWSGQGGFHLRRHCLLSSRLLKHR